MCRECESGHHGRFVLRMHVFEAEQFCQGVADSALIKSVNAVQDPTCLQQYRFGNPDWPSCKQRLCGGGLFGVVLNEQSDHHVSIDRDHGAESPRVEWPCPSAPAFLICVWI